MNENTKNFIKRCLFNSFVISMVLSLGVALIDEMLGRRSVVEGIRYVVHNPLNYAINTSIVFLFMAISILVKRRIFVYVLASTLWLLIGIVNFIILGYRNTPFTFVDIQLAAAGLAVMDKYMSSLKIVGAVLGLAAVLVLLVVFFLFGPKTKKKISVVRNLIVYVGFLAGFLALTRLGLQKEVIVTEFGNIPIAYEKYGVPYCFGITFLDNGIDKPLNYNETTVKKLKKKIDKVPDKKAKEKPNIIFVQLESFFDVSNVKKLKVSQDPMPNFHRLAKNYSSGYLKMPSYGAGTANSEFEVITGMCRSFFGCGEYPYKSVLQKKTCESVPNSLKSEGYHTTAIHNNRAEFYDRNLIFSHIGFDHFISLECMSGTEPSSNGWTKDNVLPSQIMKALNSTQERDYIYTISVEGHGEYPTTPMENPTIELSGLDDEDRLNKLTHYTNQVYSMDQMVGDLTEQLSEFDEKTVVVFFGDHLPSIDFERREMKNKSIYETEYVIWANFPMKKMDKKLKAYQLGATVLGRVGMNPGVLNKYHQNFKEKSSYMNNLELLQYDMLYGQRYIYNKENPFPATNIIFGVDDIKINRVVRYSKKTILYGEGFTPYSKVYLNDKQLASGYLNPGAINVNTEAIEDLKEGDVLSVRYTTKSRTQLRRSDDYAIKAIKKVKKQKQKKEKNKKVAKKDKS